MGYSFEWIPAPPLAARSDRLFMFASGGPDAQRRDRYRLAVPTPARGTTVTLRPRSQSVAKVPDSGNGPKGELPARLPIERRRQELPEVTTFEKVLQCPTICRMGDEQNALAIVVALNIGEQIARA